jgi:DNA-binding NarL/FixJ family response regulator
VLDVFHSETTNDLAMDELRSRVRMDKYKKLVVISAKEQWSHLCLLAQAAGLNVVQQRVDALTVQPYDEHLLIAVELPGLRLDRTNMQLLSQLQQQGGVFVYQADRQLLEEASCLRIGLRGVLYRDLPLDQLMLALKTLMNGQLAFSLEVLSQRLDELGVHLPDPIDNQASSCNATLTKQEKRIIKLVAQGARNKEIALELHISAHTVKAHMAAIFRKTQVRNRVELLRLVQLPLGSQFTDLARLD